MSPAELVRRFASGLRFPQLFLLVAGLFVADLLMPDLIPFVDEVMLALATMLLGSWKRRKGGAPEEPELKDVTPPSQTLED